MYEAGEFTECCGSQSARRRYRCEGRDLRRINRRGESGWLESATKITKEAFLPQGYPDSVSSDYLSYQIWDSTQAFCSSITGTLATMAVLKGVGVGDSTATPLAATITWMLKDGTGMMGRILFAWMRGTDLDCYSKQWRLVADVLNDVGIMLDLLAPMFPGVFLLIACVASLSRAIVGVAGSATRAAFVQHQARRDNMADVAAKDGSQETLVNLLGLIVNLVITPSVAQSQLAIWMLFVLFTTLHLWANYCAVSALCMETLNKNRLHIVIDCYLRTGTILSPQYANAREPILTRVSRELNFDLGVSLSNALRSSVNYDDAVSEASGGRRKYTLVLGKTERNVSICLRGDSDVRNQLEAVLVVEFANYIWTNGMNGPALSMYNKPAQKSCGNVLKVSQTIVESLYPELVASLSAKGWVTTHFLLGAEDWRFTWGSNEDLNKTL